MAGALEGIRILDLTTIFSGPICTSILGDQGADVIKIESPSGDWMRTPQNVARNGVGGSFAMMNRNKRSIVIDLSEESGRTLLKEMVPTADVVVENYRPGVMERLGLEYDVLKKLNPKLIFASINGVGPSGPYANRRVYDAIIQAVSGMATLQAAGPEGRPVMVNSLICDKLTSLFAAQSISSALVARERTGLGQRIDIAMLDAALFFMWPDNMMNFTFVGDDVPHFQSLTHTNYVRQTRDGWVCTMPVQQDEWLGVFRTLDLPNLMTDPAYISESGINMELLNETLNAAYRQFDTEDLLQRLEENQVPFARINNREDVLEDPQVQAMDTLWEFEHTFGGPMRQARPPARFSETPSEIFRCSPELGEHSDEVLAEYGLDKDQIKRLRADRIIR